MKNYLISLIFMQISLLTSLVSFAHEGPHKQQVLEYALSSHQERHSEQSQQKTQSSHHDHKPIHHRELKSHSSLETHDHSHCCQQNIDFKTAPKTEREAINRALDIFHFAIDGEHEHSHHSAWETLLSAFKPSSWVSFTKSLFHKNTWKLVRRNANLVRASNDAYKAYSIESQHSLSKEHAQNLLMVFPISHAIEMISSPVFLYSSQFMDLSTGLVATIGAGLATISLPGVDILCIVIFVSYPLKAVHRSISNIKKPIFDVGRSLKKTYQVLSAFDRRYIYQDGIHSLNHDFSQWIANQTHYSQSTIAKNQNTLILRIINPDHTNVGELLFTKNNSSTQNDTTYLKSATFNSHSSSDIKIFKGLINSLGLNWNNQYNLKRAINTLGSESQIKEFSKQFYVKEAYQTHDFTHFQFEEQSITVPGRYVKKPSLTCTQLFNL